jgi:hypothetical protein
MRPVPSGRSCRRNTPQTRRLLSYRSSPSTPDNGATVNNHGRFSHAGTTGTENTSGSRTGSGSNDGRGIGGRDCVAAGGCVARLACRCYSTRTDLGTGAAAGTVAGQGWVAVDGRRGALARVGIPVRRCPVGYSDQARADVTRNRGATRKARPHNGQRAYDQQQLHGIPSIARH